MEDLVFTFYNEELDRNQTFNLSKKQANFCLQGVARKDFAKAIFEFAAKNGIFEEIFEEDEDYLTDKRFGNSEFVITKPPK